jgi:hypothetical protein
VPREWLTELERLLAASSAADAQVLVAVAAGRSVPLEPDEAHAVARRALLLHAAGGDALRPYDLDSRAVLAAAADLDAPERRLELERGLDELAAAAHRLPHLERAASRLAAEPELAWRAWACGVLLDALGEGE